MINNFEPNENLMGASEKRSRSDIIFFIVLAVMTVIVLVIAYLNAFVFMLVQVDGESMLPTFNTGDVVIVNRKSEISKGDIVIIEGEKQGAYIIKRVIAVGGESVELKNGYVYVDDKMINEPYVIKQGATAPLDGGKTEWQVLDGEVFFLGDNRLNSKDSRSDEYGTCQREQIVGVVEEWSTKMIGFNKFLYGLNG